MAVGATYVGGQTGQVLPDLDNAPVALAQAAVAADDLWVALESLGLVVEP